MSQTNSDINTKSRMSRTFSGSDSDPSFSGESSDDSHRGSKLYTKPYSHEDSKRTRLDSHPTTTNLDDEMMENADSLFSSQGSLFNSQQSFKDELFSSQPVGVGNGVSEFCNQPSSGTTYMTFTRPDVQEANQQDNARRKQPKKTKGITKGQEELSSQKSSNHLDKLSDQDDQRAKNRKYARDSRERKINKQLSLEQLSDPDDQRAKNRKYARDSRERKNKKLFSLERANNHQRSIIQIYTKAITVLYKKLHGGADPKWAKYEIPWFNSRDGECEECQSVTCLLPVEDYAFFEELGNNTFGTIIAPQSDVGKIYISEIMPTHKNHSNSTGLLKMSPGANFTPSLQRRSSDIQILPATRESTDNCSDRRTRSENSMSNSTLIFANKPELHYKVSRDDFYSLNEASSQIPILSQKARNVPEPGQINADVNNPSSSTQSAGNAHIFAATHPVNTNGTFNGGGDFRAAQMSYKPCPIVAPVDMSRDGQSFSNVSNQNYIASNGNNLNNGQPDFIGYDKQPEHGSVFLHQPGESTMSSLSQSAMFAPMNEAEKPEDSQGTSSMENRHQDIPEVEDLQASLETV